MKKIIFSLTALAVILLSLTISSCKPEETVTKPEGISGSINSDETVNLKAGVNYILDGPLIVKEGGTLNIGAGTVIKVRKGFSNYVLVLQGGKINANGTAANPIRFTADTSTAEAGHWGGLIINGKAPLAGGSAGTTEINPDYAYGGGANPIPNDNSGVLTYLILEYTGARSNTDVEHNALTLNGVGSGTKIENIYVLESADDGIELFGGNVEVKNLLVVNPDDDMFDFTQGYTGTLENVYGIWTKGYISRESDPRGIEADGNFDGNFPTQSGQSDFTVNNITVELKLDYNTGKTTQMQDLFKIRRGAKATITNALVKGTGAVGDLMDFTDTKGMGKETSNISLTNSLSNPISGKTVNGIAPNATVVQGKTGCPTDIFSWTKWPF